MSTDTEKLTGAVPEVVTRVARTPGLYVATTPALPLLMVPIYVDARGRTWSMRVDEGLSHEGFGADIEFSGPLTPDSSKI